jgi:hypothetical protein
VDVGLLVNTPGHGDPQELQGCIRGASSFHSLCPDSAITRDLTGIGAARNFLCARRFIWRRSEPAGWPAVPFPATGAAGSSTSYGARNREVDRGGPRGPSRWRRERRRRNGNRLLFQPTGLPAPKSCSLVQWEHRSRRWASQSRSGVVGGIAGRCGGARLGINVRCESVLYHLTHDAAHPSPLARDAYYFERALQCTLVDLSQSGVIQVRTTFSPSPSNPREGQRHPGPTVWPCRYATPRRTPKGGSS